MTKRKNVVSKMLLLVVILTLISCCFLGSTFARYTSSGSGTGTLEVATWKLSHAGDNIDVNFNMLSPSKDVYSSKVRSNSTGRLLVATITYEVDVETILTFSTSEAVFGGSPAYGSNGVASDGIPTEEEVKEVFSIALYVNESGNDADAATAYSEITLEAESSGTIYVYAEVTWTSDTAAIKGDNADKRDTWIGGNITGLTYNISYTAVQSTQIPEA